jgi:hypothetical protein
VAHAASRDCYPNEGGETKRKTEDEEEANPSFDVVADRMAAPEPMLIPQGPDDQRHDKKRNEISEGPRRVAHPQDSCVDSERPVIQINPLSRRMRLTRYRFWAPVRKTWSR